LKSTDGRTGSTYNFVIAKDRNIVRTPKWGHKASRMYTTSTDSGRHTVRWRATTVSGDNLGDCPNIFIVPNPKQAYS